MFRTFKNRKIFSSIVEFIFVYVMDMLILIDGSFKKFTHNISMFFHISTIRINSFVWNSYPFITFFINIFSTIPVRIKFFFKPTLFSKNIFSLFRMMLSKEWVSFRPTPDWKIVSFPKRRNRTYMCFEIISNFFNAKIIQIKQFLEFLQFNLLSAWNNPFWHEKNIADTGLNYKYYFSEVF